MSYKVRVSVKSGSRDFGVNRGPKAFKTRKGAEALAKRSRVKARKIATRLGASVSVKVIDV